MSQTTTTPFPLLEEQELSATPNRISSYLPLQGKEEEIQRTEWQSEPSPSVCLFAGTKIDQMYAYVIALLVRMRQAKINDELTRPVAFPGAWWKEAENVNYLQWLELKRNSLVHARYCSAGYTPLPVQVSPETERPQPEFVWDKNIFNALQAVEEFSKETHAHY